MTDVYQAPESQLTEPTSSGEYGSVEKALTGDYNFDIGELFSEGWQKSKGSKLTINLGFILYIVLYLVISVALPAGVAAIAAGTGAAGTLNILVSIVAMLVMMPAWAGLFMMGIKRSVDQPFTPTEVLNYFGKLVPLALAMIVMYVLLVLGFLLLVIPGIYLMFAYMMTMSLIVEKDMGFWQAMETSRKSVTKKWFRFFGFSILSWIILGIAAIPAGLGLIWAGPWLLISWGCLYRNMYGVEPR